MKPTILLLFGGESSEHEVSTKSAANVLAAIDANQYQTVLVYIDKQGAWHLADAIDDHDGPEVVPQLGKKSFLVPQTQLVIKPDVIFPVLHGANGEDGTVQGLARLLHIPVVGCGVLASAVCMDKDMTKRLLLQADVPVTPWVALRQHQTSPTYALAARQLDSSVLFVKPARAGSSVGVSKVKTEDDFAPALTAAFEHDNRVLIEKAINGRELECAVLGNAQPQASQVGEIVPDREFYSYESKYDSASTSKVIIPADIPKDMGTKIQAMALQAYQALDCQGLARVDFLVDGDHIYLNELNTMPGFTDISMYPKLWEAAGMAYPQLISRLIALALETSAKEW